MAPSPNSRYLATAGSYDKLIKVWDIIQGRTIASFPAHSNDINAINYSPNGRYIVSAAGDNTIKVWNAYDFSLLNTIKRPEAELDVIFTPDSKKLVAGGNDSLVKILDLNSGAVLQVFKNHRAAVTSLCFVPTNSNILYSAGSDSMVYKWNLAKNDWDHWYNAPARIMNVDISSNGKYMSLTCTDTLIRVWNIETNKFYFSLRPNYSIAENVDIAFPAFSPDSRYMTFARTNDTLDILELATLRQQSYRFKTERRQGMYDMLYSPDGSYLVARTNLGGPLRIFNFSGWDYLSNPTLNMKEVKQYANIPLAVQFTRDDKGLAVVHQAISKFDLRNGSTSHLYYGAFLFQNNYILLNDEKKGLYSELFASGLKIYDLVNNKDIMELSLPDKMEELKRFELTADNRYVFLGGVNNSIAGFSLPSGKELFHGNYDTGPEKGVNFIRYDSIRQRLYVIGKNDTISVIDPFKGKKTATLIANRPQSIEVSPVFLYVTCDKSLVYKYDAKTLKLLKKIKVHNSGIDCYGSVMSYDYKYLVVQVADKFVTLDTRTEKVLYEKYDHDYANGTMSVSHDNRLLATGGFDSRINLYQLATGKKISTIYTPRDKDFMLNGLMAITQPEEYAGSG
jgi:WD40 repeat protein